MRSRQWLALFALSLPIVALSVDMNGVVVLLPSIGADLGVSAATAGAIVTCASLAFAAPLLLIGRVADRVGARPILLAGVVGFAIASGLCAVSETFALMIAGRALQGVSSACCFTTSLAAIDAMFEGESQPLAVGIWGALGGIGGACGPLVASLLANAWSWRAFFGVNIVLLSVAFVLLLWLVPKLPSDPTRTVPVLTLTLLMLGIGFGCAAIQHAAAGGWLNAFTVGGLALGAVFLGLVARRRSPANPLVPARVTRLAPFRLGTATATLSNWGSGVVMVLVPTALELVRHTSVLETGILFLAFSVPFALGGVASGFMIRVRNAPATLALGSAAMVIGMVALAIVGPDGPLGSLLITLAVTGFGNGVVYSAATSYALIDIAPDDAGGAAAVLSAARVLGLALAVALSTSLMATIDDAWPGGTWGLRIALLLAAGITGVGWWLARRAPVATADRR
jgi:DHA2 family methylenomycin A resistance protein-like MFS transporter